MHRFRTLTVLLALTVARPTTAFPQATMSTSSSTTASAAAAASSAFHTTFWNSVAGKYDDTSDKTNEYRDRRLKLLLDERYLKQDDTVLDFACATGRLSMDMSPHVKSVLGIDLSEGMIEKAKEKLAGASNSNVQFATTDLFDASLDGKAYSVVTAFNVLHLVPAPEMFLRRIRDVMAPRGLIIAETPCMGTKPWYFRQLIGLAGMTGLMPKATALTMEQVEVMVTGEGFEIVKATSLEGGDPLIVARRVEREAE